MTIATVRTIIRDKAQYDRASAIGDASTLEFLLPNTPVVSGSAKVYVAGVLKATPADYTVDHDLGLVTFVAAPALSAAIIMTYQHTILSDADITAFLTMESNNDRRAAADALDTIASNEALVQKAIKLGDLTTNGPAVAKALREHAAQLRADADKAEAAEDGGAFDIAEQIPTDFAYREKLWAEALREG